jgi:DNA-directed RNA polymerase specialized sigma24 family protein
MADSRRDFKEILVRANGGDNPACDKLFALADEELKKLAQVRLYRIGHRDVLDAAALIHEVRVRFMRARGPHIRDRGSFFAFASEVMRQVIVEMVRARHARYRRSGDAELAPSTQPSDLLPGDKKAIVDVDDARLALEREHPWLANVFEVLYDGNAHPTMVHQMWKIAQSLQNSFQRAMIEARAQRHELFTVEHLLAALLQDETARPVLVTCGADLDLIAKELDEFIKERVPVVPDNKLIDPYPLPALGFQRVLQRAALRVGENSNTEIDGARCLFAIFGEKDSRAVFLLQEHGVSPLDVANLIRGQ